MRRVIAIALAGASALREQALAAARPASFGDYFKSDAADLPGPARVAALGRRCQDVARTGLQDALLRLGDHRRPQLHRQLRAGQIPAGHRHGERDQELRRPDRARHRRDRSEPGVCGTAAGGAAAQGAQDAPEEEAEACGCSAGAPDWPSPTRTRRRQRQPLSCRPRNSGPGSRLGRNRDRVCAGAALPGRLRSCSAPSTPHAVRSAMVRLSGPGSMLRLRPMGGSPQRPRPPQPEFLHE